ncbi:glutathione S-transferase family protein [Pseudomarimonas salicorniae]|uniref:Glutathione S-transferase family protein n=1 Tax=Pseudomarimonas salicorniae TaxID=2933270 RepID=A0ABT0GE79_9GAMM|nr:glutathione S-transferase family protein [Lysobacter sp. CAU 1642]MCK7592852.1 glutathione S-transferase family protein [Lysobacter sp. CAU 1642]
MQPLLVIGNKNYSSWSLRPWLLLKAFGVPFEERRLALGSEEFRREIARFSPSGRVPVLHHQGRVIWDSLAIVEYANEVFLDGRGWPTDLDARALARSASAEMHSGFTDLRTQLPMNCGRDPSTGVYRWDANAQRDIDRVQQLWRELRGRAGSGEFLCGAFGIVDAMFAPVAVRFRGYGVALDDTARAYCDAVEALPAMREWREGAAEESERLAKYDNVGQ